MNDSAVVEAAWALNQSAVERARRLATALAMIREGRTPKEARELMRVRFRISRVTAWRIVDIASDMAGVQR